MSCNTLSIVKYARPTLHSYTSTHNQKPKQDGERRALRVTRKREKQALQAERLEDHVNESVDDMLAAAFDLSNQGKLAVVDVIEDDIDMTIPSISKTLIGSSVSRKEPKYDRIQLAGIDYRIDDSEPSDISDMNLYTNTGGLSRPRHIHTVLTTAYALRDHRALHSTYATVWVKVIPVGRVRCPALEPMN
jgi:hypothetical protein